MLCILSEPSEGYYCAVFITIVNSVSAFSMRPMRISRYRFCSLGVFSSLPCRGGSQRC